MKKRGEMHIDLKFTKLQKKAEHFSPAADPLLIINFIWAKNINQKGVGAKI